MQRWRDGKTVRWGCGVPIKMLRVSRGRGLLTTGLRVLALGILLLLIVEAAREGIAAYYLKQNSPEAVEKAMAWDPADAVYPATAANLIHLYSENPNPQRVVSLYRRAVLLSPFDASYCVELAQAEEWAGRPAIAASYYHQALELFPKSPEINWKVANFSVRRGNPDAALPLLRNVLSSGLIPRDQVFELTASARLDPAAVIDDVLPDDAATIGDYLNFQVDRGNASAATMAWDRLLRLASSFEIYRTFHYLDWLIKSHEIDRAKQAWASVVARFPSRVPDPASSTNLVTNGDFKAESVNGGLDWLTYPVAGATVSYEVGTGAGAGGYLRIDFDGSQNLYYDAVAQFVPVEPHRKYEFSVRERALGITTESGVAMQILDAYAIGKVFGTTEPIAGTVSWEERKFCFTTGNDTRLVLLTVVRKRSSKLEGKIAGSVWFSKAVLAPIG
jgi:Flp pilus assembly protein TadD